MGFDDKISKFAYNFEETAGMEREEEKQAKIVKRKKYSMNHNQLHPPGITPSTSDSNLLSSIHNRSQVYHGVYGGVGGLFSTPKVDIVSYDGFSYDGGKQQHFTQRKPH